MRKWFNHEPEKWKEFRKKYYEELDTNIIAVKTFCHSINEPKTITLLYAAKDTQHTHAIVLKEYLLSVLKEKAN